MAFLANWALWICGGSRQWEKSCTRREIGKRKGVSMFSTIYSLRSGYISEKCCFIITTLCASAVLNLLFSFRWATNRLQLPGGMKSAAIGQHGHNTIIFLTPAPLLISCICSLLGCATVVLGISVITVNNLFSRRTELWYYWKVKYPMCGTLIQQLTKTCCGKHRAVMASWT